MKKFELCIAFSLLITLHVTAKTGKRIWEDAEFSVEEDARLSFQQLTYKYGYESESHEVQTADGYILTVHRIPYRKRCRYANIRPPILVLHGLLCSSVDWIIMGPEKSLGYILADNCYDVWLGNSRGNTESRKHVSMNPRDRSFWNFSWHEMGVYDLPAIVQYICDRTGSLEMHYIGHSQGTTQFFIFSSLYPEFARRIRSMHALAPVAYLGNLKRPVLQALSHFHGPIERLSKMVGLYEFLPRSEFLVNLGSRACRDKYPKLQAMCSNILFLICGYDSEQMNYTMLPAILGHTPAGASTRQIIHYAQSMKSGRAIEHHKAENSVKRARPEKEQYLSKYSKTCSFTGRFRQYDFGRYANYYYHYNSQDPPDYEIGRIEVPIALYYSDNDRLVDVDDVDRLASEIPHLIMKYRIPFRRFNHLDYMYAKDAKELVYDRILEMLSKCLT